MKNKDLTSTDKEKRFLKYLEWIVFVILIFIGSGYLLSTNSLDLTKISWAEIFTVFFIPIISSVLTYAIKKIRSFQKLIESRDKEYEAKIKNWKLEFDKISLTNLPNEIDVLSQYIETGKRKITELNNSLTNTSEISSKLLLFSEELMGKLKGYNKFTPFVFRELIDKNFKEDCFRFHEIRTDVYKNILDNFSVRVEKAYDAIMSGDCYPDWFFINDSNGGLTKEEKIGFLLDINKLGAKGVVVQRILIFPKNKLQESLSKLKSQGNFDRFFQLNSNVTLHWITPEEIKGLRCFSNKDIEIILKSDFAILDKIVVIKQVDNDMLEIIQKNETYLKLFDELETAKNSLLDKTSNPFKNIDEIKNLIKNEETSVN